MPDRFTATCFHYWLEDQAALTPDSPAVVCGDTVLTYADLNTRANRIAHRIAAMGGGGQPIALLGERSAATITALLGILKAGSPYVPLLPGAPQRRLVHQITQTKAPIVVTDGESLMPPVDDVAELRLDPDGSLPESDTAANPARTSLPDDLAYIVYTSGSTGTPKGVAVRHDNLVNYVASLSRKLGRSPVSSAPGLSFATVSTLTADLGNTCVFPSLATGGCLHVIEPATALDAGLFASYLKRQRIDVLKITPTHLAALAAAEGERVLPARFLITGGEPAPWELLDVVRRRAGLAWINHYGPTETTIGSLTFDVLSGLECRKWAATVPIGRPIANTAAYVLDDRRQPVERGREGELYIGGRGVSAGYLHEPLLTSERFFDDPFASEPGGKMYRTGDRVRQLPEGSLVFLGRSDDQVKVRGFRIELGEIESAIRRQPGVTQTVVVAREDRAGDVRLVAYVVATKGSSWRHPHDWRDALARELPSFMVPHALVPLEQLPLTPNGKIDRRALPAPSDETRPGASAVQAPQSDLERRISAIWKDVLDLKEVDVDADFFAIGGDSLKAMHLIARIEKDLDRRVPHATFIKSPTVAAIARAVALDARGTFASLVPLQPHGSRPPLFCVHGGGGHCYYYRDLARRLGPDQPFWGLQGRHVDGRHPRQNTVEEMAAFYLHEIKQVAPRGPYYLAGASFGGKVALEMAHMLRRQGETVALLAMFDTWGPGYPRFRVGRAARAVGWLYRRAEHHIGSLLLLERGQRTQYLRAKAAKTWQELVDLAAARLPGRHRRADGNGINYEDESFVALASRSYRPQFYPGRVVLFRSKQQPLGIDRDPTLGWYGLVGELDIHDVVGLHAAVVAEPRVKHLVDRLRPCLDAAQANYHPADSRRKSVPEEERSCDIGSSVAGSAKHFTSSVPSGVPVLRTASARR